MKLVQTNLVFTVKIFLNSNFIFRMVDKVREQTSPVLRIKGKKTLSEYISLSCFVLREKCFHYFNDHLRIFLGDMESMSEIESDIPE